MSNGRGLERVRLIAITDVTRVSAAHQLQRAQSLCQICQPGTVMIQLRDRQLGARDRLAMGLQLRDVIRSYSQRLCVNDRLDLAGLLDADCVHLGESSIHAADVRERFADRFAITRASHDPSQCSLSGADAVLLSPVCSPRKGADALGFKELRRACELSQAPVFALGGVDASNATGCIAAGASGVAVIGAWLDAGRSLAQLASALGISQGG